MRWTVGRVARSCGVSTRTLRHYDARGLLVPDRDPANGYRVYRRSHLLRLQRILLLRSFGLSLGSIAEVLDDELDDTEALRKHLKHVEAEQERLTRLACTLRRTLSEVTGGPPVDVMTLFDGFERRRDEFEHRLVKRYGSDVREHFDDAAAITDGWDQVQATAAAAEGRELLVALASLRASGVSPDDARVMPLITVHRESVRAFWDASNGAYRALADEIVEDPVQRQLIDEVAPDLAPWLRAAILAHTVEDSETSE